MRTPSTALFERAYRLTYFLHPDKRTALGILLGAWGKLEAAVTAQDRRRYYRPGGRLLSGLTGLRRSRNRVNLDRAQLLQRLIYGESELWERRWEEAEGRAPHAQELTVRYVRHLVDRGLHRNAFYLTVALSRLLYHDCTEETMTLYHLVLQDPDHFKDDFACRRAKKRLLEELRQIFGDRLEICRGPRGEELPRRHPEPGPLAQLVERCLVQFTPWGTECVLSAGRDAMSLELPSLGFDGGDPDGEHPVEMRRIHTLIHPPCFERLAGAAGLAPPAHRLAVPLFQMGKSGGDAAGGGEGGAGVDRENPPALTSRERSVLAEELKGRAQRKRRWSGNELSVRLDGREATRLAVPGPRCGGTSRMTLAVQEGARLMEVWGLDPAGEVLLAACPLPGEVPAGEVSAGESSAPENRLLRLGRGRQITFQLAPGATAGSLRVTVIWEQKRRRLGFLLPSVPLPSFFSGGWPTAGRAARGLFPAALASLILALALILHLPFRNPAPVAPSSPSSPPMTAPDPAGDRVRDGGAALPSPTLRQAKSVWVDPLGETPAAVRLRSRLSDALVVSSRFRIAARREVADAVLKPAIGDASGEVAGGLSLLLVNAAGQVLWQGRATGEAKAAAEQVVKSLGGYRQSP